MSNSESHPVSGGELGAKVAAQGELVRQLKADKKPKEEIDAAVKTLLSLKVRTVFLRVFNLFLLLFQQLRLSTRPPLVRTGNLLEEVSLPRSKTRRKRRKRRQR